MQKKDLIYYEFRKKDGIWKDIVGIEHISLQRLFECLHLPVPDDSITYCLYDNAYAFVKYRNCWSHLRVYVKKY